MRHQARQRTRLVLAYPVVRAQDVGDDPFMEEDGANAARPRWHWEKRGGARLFSGDGAEFVFVDSLTRIEVERLLKLQELDAVRIECAYLANWVGPAEARDLWLQAETLLDADEDWGQSPSLSAGIPFRVELWRAADGRHAIVIIDN